MTMKENFTAGQVVIGQETIAVLDVVIQATAKRTAFNPVNKISGADTLVIVDNLLNAVIIMRPVSGDLKVYHSWRFENVPFEG